VHASIPTACDFRSAGLSFGIRHSEPVRFMVPFDFFQSIIAFDAEGAELGIPMEQAIRKWNAGEFPIDPGIHQDLPIFHTPEVYVDDGYGKRTVVTLTVSLRVERQLFYGHLTISHLSGFKDELSGGVITNAFTTDILDIDEVEQRWMPVASEADMPTLTLQGLVGWTE
jgi:hypothetical protein